MCASKLANAKWGPSPTVREGSCVKELAMTEPSLTVGLGLHNDYILEAKRQAISLKKLLPACRPSEKFSAIVCPISASESRVPRLTPPCALFPNTISGAYSRV